jgi:hypothetical protein
VTLSAADLDNISAAIIAGGLSCTGSGRRSVTIYAVDTSTGTAVRVSGVTVSATSGATGYGGETGLDGKIVFSLDDGTWIIAGNDGQNSYTPNTLTVNGVEIDSIMTNKVVIAAPAISGQATAYVYISEAGAPNTGAYGDCEGCVVRFTLESQDGRVLTSVTDTSTNEVIYDPTQDCISTSSGYAEGFLRKTDNLVYKDGSNLLHPVWRVTISNYDVKQEPLWDRRFSIPHDSTTINLGNLR